MLLVNKSLNKVVDQMLKQDDIENELKNGEAPNGVARVIDYVIEKTDQQPIKKICSSCKKEKYLDEFSRDRTTKTGFHSLCKKCQVEKNRKYRSRLKEKRGQTRRYCKICQRQRYVTKFKDNEKICLDCLIEKPKKEEVKMPPEKKEEKKDNIEVERLIHEYKIRRENLSIELRVKLAEMNASKQIYTVMIEDLEKLIKE